MITHAAHSVRQAFRTLRRRPGFALVAIITLALGIGPTTAIISVGNALLLRSLPYPEGERIVAIWQGDRTKPDDVPGGHISHPALQDVRAQVTSLEAAAQWRRINPTLTGLGPAELLDGARVTPDFFRVFGSTPALGRGFTEAEDVNRGPNVVVIADAFFRERLGGSDDVIGSTLTLGGAAYEIIGVAPRGFGFPDNAQLWLPLQNDDEGCGRGCVSSQGVARLAPGASLEQASGQLRQLGARLEAAYPASNTNVTLRVAPLRDVVVGSARTPIVLLLGAVAMVLLIACANVANLVLVHGDARRTEIAVRAALGADRRTIVRQLMVENTLLALLGGSAGLLLGAWTIAALKAVAPDDIPRLAEIGMDGRVLVVAAVIILSTVLIFGLAPALRLASTSFQQALRQGRISMTERSTRRFRSTVLVAQVTLSVMLLLGAALMVRSMIRMRSVDLGIDSRAVAQFRIALSAARYPTPDAAVAFVRQLDERLEALPQVERASAIVSVPFTSLNIFSGFTRPDLPDPDPGSVPTASYRALDPDALDVLGIRLRRGRGFTDADRWGTQPVALINEAAARKYWPGEDPIGKQIIMQVTVGYPDTLPRTIVGVTADFRRAVIETPQPEVYVPYAQVAASFPQIALRFRGADAGAVLLAAQRELQTLDPTLAMARAATLESLIRRDLAAPAFYLMILATFAILAAVLAGVGIYGVVAYLVTRRKHEIGIRIALGAHLRQILQLVVWQGLRPALLGAAAGIAGALATARVMRSILFETAPTDLAAIIATALFLLAVVIVATAVPALRAARIPPSEVLRT